MAPSAHRAPLCDGKSRNCNAPIRAGARHRGGGNATGGAISDGGTLVAVSNCEPGGVRAFDAGTLAPVADISTCAKTVGLVAAPGRRFVFSLREAAGTWITDFSPGAEPCRGLITGDGRTCIAALFGEHGLTAIDLWAEPPAPRRSLEVSAGTASPGVRVFALARPDGRQVWVSFAPVGNGTVQIIDTVSAEVVRDLNPGPEVLHMECTPGGQEGRVAVRDAGRIDVCNTATFEKLAEIPAAPAAPTGPALIPETLGRMRGPDLAAVITQGRAATRMPAILDTLTGEEITALTARLETRPRTRRPRSRAWRHDCAGRSRGRGSRW